jgi:hypothetical protein
MDQEEHLLEEQDNDTQWTEDLEEDLEETDASSLQDEEEQERIDNQDEYMEDDPSEPAPLGNPSYQQLKWKTLKNVVSNHNFLLVNIAIIAVLFLFLIIFVVLAYTGSSSGLDYVAPKCSQVRVTLGSGDNAYTQNLSIEEYLVSHIYSATKNLDNINDNLYRVLSIVFNTEMQASGNCSRTYIPEVDDIYEFEILDSNSDTYDQILKTINSVKNTVMVKKNTDEYFTTSVDGFCSFSSSMENEDEDFDISFPSEATSTEYTIPQLSEVFPYDWVDENVYQWNFKNCPCNDSSNASPDCFLEEWNYPDDEEPDLIYVDGGTGTGVSIYATHYLTTQANKTYEGVLKLFYPDKDWEFKTNDPTEANKKEFGSHTCSGTNVPFNSTPLSRNEFISLVIEFFSTANYASYAQYFIDYAGSIYDMGVDKNINPELIYIFARKETGFTTVSSDTNHYNYYGMGHCNTCSHGTFYDSFMEGVEDLFDYFVRAGSLEAVVRKYSYLGDYLANPGGPGDGGCYYLKLPEIYGENYSRCNSSYHCASSGGGAGCVKTTDEEKDAYIQWQAEKYVQHRQAIFKLGKEICQSAEGIYGDTTGTTFLNDPIANFLPTVGSSLEEFNEAIYRDGCNNLGTGAGVAYVSSRAVMQLAEYGKKFHYVWGGLHGSAPVSYGVLPGWGPQGPDCSGFVSWALYNVGFSWTSLTATEWGKLGTVVELGDSRLQVGDFILTPGDRGFNHIVIITNINNTEGYYNVVHASSTANGVIFGRVSFNERNRKGELMSDYYARAQKSDAFKNFCKSKGY